MFGPNLGSEQQMIGRFVLADDKMTHATKTDRTGPGQTRRKQQVAATMTVMLLDGQTGQDELTFLLILLVPSCSLLSPSLSLSHTHSSQSSARDGQHVTRWQVTVQP